MMSNGLPKSVLAVFCVLCLIGCCVIYLADPDQDISVTVNGDGSVSYEVSGFLPEEYTCMVLDGVNPKDLIYFYYDERYPTYRTSLHEVHILYTTLRELLEARGYGSFHIVDADGLRDVLSTASSASVSAIFVATGTLPDTVYVPFLLEDWMSAGGTMYWMGGNPCTRYAMSDGTMVDAQGMFDESLFNAEVSDKGATDCTYIAAEFGFGYYAIDYAIRKDVPNSVPIGLVDGTYSSLSEVVSPYGGKVYLFGGSASSMSFEQVSAFADYLVCGVTGATEVLQKEEGAKGYGHRTSTMHPSALGEVFYLKVGKPNTIVGRMVRL